MRWNWLFLVMLACASSSSLAVTVPDLYAATVAVKNESAKARTDALRRALGEVMVRVSGRADIKQSPGVGQVLDQAQSLLQRYGYKNSKTTGLKLYSEFEGRALEQAMLKAGLPVWGASRPVTMAWVLVDGALVTQSGPEKIVSAMKAAAEQRGLPLRFPRAEVATNNNVVPADIRKGHIPRIMMVTRTYDTRHVLLGEVGKNSANWRLIVDGTTLQKWRARADGSVALAKGAVGYAAQVYSQRYARVGTEDGTVVVGIQGVHDSQAFTRVRDYLTGMTGVDEVTPMFVHDETLVLEIAGPNDAKVFERRVGTVGWLSDSQSARQLAMQYADKHPVLGYSLSR